MLSHNEIRSVAATDKRVQPWRGIAVQAVFLMGLWLVLSGHFDIFHIVAGLVSVAIVLTINARLSAVQFFPDDTFEWEHLHFRRLILFIPWLAWGIIGGSFQVASLVLHPRMPIEPTLIRFRVKLPMTGAKVMLANVITLTPGTFTLSIKGNEFLVHSLMGTSASSIIDESLPKWIARLFALEDANIISAVSIIESNEEL